MEWYLISARETLEKLNSRESGLTLAEAKARLAKNGANALREEKKKSLLGLFFSQFKDLMTMILICAAALSALLAFLTKDRSELADTGILLFIILLNAIVGFLQQYRADAAIEHLKRLSRSTAKVIREGKITVIDAEELVTGDIVEIGEGDAVPADCRILESEGFRVDESPLTGESVPVSKRDCIVKKGGVSYRKNMAYFSTFCVGGRARCAVVETGMNTEMGTVASLLSRSERTVTPLDKIITKLGKVITVTVLLAAAMLFFGSLLGGRGDFLDSLMMAIAVAVAAIPEGMGAVVTIILAMGVQRMSKRKVVMRKLSSVETLGSCTCVCSDKTGTLTQNKMSVAGVFTLSGSKEEEERLATCMAICHSVKGESGAYAGDPTEIALVEYAASRVHKPKFTVIGGVPFSSERKKMSVYAVTDKARLYVKGGADVLLKNCTRVYGKEGTLPLLGDERERINEAILSYSEGAMRVLAFAEGEDEREENLVFLGLAALFDPPKNGVKEAVRAFSGAGVRTVMITGDSADTAYEIARRLEIAKDRSEVISGEEMEKMGEEFALRAGDFSVFARVSPKDKYQIVKALQQRGEIVAMTGDGVNDAPSVRAADIGVAMGSGTDVTKNAADMVASDDDFSCIVAAVEEGRNVFFNIKRTISFFLSTNLAEVLSVLLVTLFFYRYDFLTSTQLLWINLITDSLPVVALGMQKTGGVMNRSPVRAGEIFSGRSLAFMAFFGAAQTMIVVGVFLFGISAWGNQTASTCAFLTLSLVELFHAFNVKKEDGRMSAKEFFSDKTLLFTVALGVLVNVLLVAVTPLAKLFDLVSLPSRTWVLVFALSVSIFPIGECYKAVERAIFSRHKRQTGERREVKRRKTRILSRGNTR